jgi:phosphatidylethanolamine/phosphatidyl-N-methylethanolamine N-methyltransferase
MALFDRNDRQSSDHIIASSDAATRALSVTAVENDFVEGVYGKLASWYDWFFGPTLHAGRVQAIQRMGIRADDHVLEVGVGTGINALLYPRDWVARKGITNVRLLEMDAAALKFTDNTFDIVYAPYLISVVPDPVKVAAEMSRVCKPGGRIIFLNHFRSPNFLLSRIERMISPLTVHVGFKADLDLPGFLAQAGLTPVSIEKVNIPRIWSLVTCVKP